MGYYAWNISQDCVMWMLLDGFAFKYIKEKWPIFRDEPHYVILVLAINVVNLFGEGKCNY